MTTPHERSVQSYIDEEPRWADDTVVTDLPMTAMQWRIWALAAAGKFFEGMVVFLTGVALPLMAVEFHLGPSEKGLVGASSLFGILIGASALGGLADRFGRKTMFIAEMALFAGFLALVSVSPTFNWTLVFLFGMGVALGCDYPTAHLMIAESIPSRGRGKLILSAFAFQSVGALVGTVLGFIILSHRDAVSDWRLMYASAIVPAVLVLIGRFFITESPHWLVARGEKERAEKDMARLLQRRPPYPKRIVLAASGGKRHAHGGGGVLTFLTDPKLRRAMIFAAVPWFLQDLGTYGIGIFTPTILTTLVGVPSGGHANLSEIIHNDVLSAKGAAAIDLFLVIGVVAAIFLAERHGRIRLQIYGFIGCAAGLTLAAMSSFLSSGPQIAFIITGFVVFNFMNNMGPNAMTYLLAGEVFPTRCRGAGAGFAASFAKVGAVLTAYLFPVLLHKLGTSTVLAALVCTSLLGAYITSSFSIETTGKNLEEMDSDAVVGESSARASGSSGITA